LVRATHFEKGAAHSPNADYVNLGDWDREESGVLIDRTEQLAVLITSVGEGSAQLSDRRLQPLLQSSLSIKFIGSGRVGDRL
jgi:hypothetical protein